MHKMFICFFILLMSHYQVSTDSLHTFIEPTEHMFAWINSFMDKTNPIPYRTSVQDLHEIITLFHTNLTIKKDLHSHQLERDIAEIVSVSIAPMQGGL